jgi:general nucleoside transport system permease protein
MEFLLFIQLVLTGAIRAGTAVLYATLGETVTERAGVVNLGTEGCMVMGACIGFVVAADTGSLWLAIPAAALSGGALSLIHAYLVVTRGANQLASGLALGFFGLGITALIGRPYVSKNIDGLPSLPIPVLGDIPFAGRIFFQHDLLTYAAFLIAPLIWLFLYRTRWGLVLRAVGESPAVTYSTGRNPALIQYAAIFFGGSMAALGGAQLSLSVTRTWVEGMSAGYGFIAAALVIFGMWHPLRAMLGAFIFGGAVALQFQLQSRGVQISPYLLLMLPYLLTLSILLLFGGKNRFAAPAALTAVFQRAS